VARPRLRVDKMMFSTVRLMLSAATMAVPLSVPLAQGAQLRLARGDRHDLPGERQQVGRFLQSYTRFQDQQSPFDRFRFRPTQADVERAQRLRSGATDTVRVLCLRVEFVEDTTPLTTGNGKMDTFGFLSPDSGLFYDPPHFKTYFERQMEGLRNYFLAQSLGKLYVDFVVMPEDDRTSYQLPREMQFYGDTTSWEAIEVGLVRMMRDAFKAADEDPAIDFARFDEFIVFHAGSGLQADFGLRGDSPFDLLAGEIPAGAIQAYLGEPYISVDSGRTRIEQATVLPEMMRQDTMYGDYVNLLGMTGLAGTLYHEFAHLLGAYDLYDVTGVTMGVGSWSLMGYGGWLGDYGAGSPPGVIPGFMDAYHRVALGFVNPLVVRGARESVQVFAAQMDSATYALRSDTSRPTVLKIPINDDEYFLVENRQVDVRQPDTIDVDVEDGVVINVSHGEYDFFQPGSGVLIWHVDERVLADYGPYNAVNIDAARKGVDLEEADGVQDYDVPYWRSRAPDYEIYGYRYDPFFIGAYNDRFTSTTHPSTDGYTGRSHLRVELLGWSDTLDRLKDTVMTVRVGWDLSQPGFPVRRGNSPFLPAMAADVDLDGAPEIVALDTAGLLTIFRGNGTIYRSLGVGSSVRGAPAVGDVSAGPRPEVVVADFRGRVTVFSDSGAPVTMHAGDRIFAAPVLADLDADGKKDIIVGATDGRLYAWRGTGEALPGFPLAVGSEIRAAVAVTDTVAPRIAVLTADSRLLLVEPDGSVVPGFPATLGTSPYYSTAQPLVGDFNRDGVNEVMVIAAGGHDYALFVVDQQGGLLHESRELIRSPFPGNPAIADLDADGFPDVLAASNNDLVAIGPSAALVGNYPLKQDSLYSVTELAGNWIITYEVAFQFTSSPVVGDVDGDGRPDIVIGSPKSGVLSINSTTGRQSPGFPLMTTSPVSATPLLLDFDSDGDVEVAVGSDDGDFFVWDLPGASSGVVWPCAYHDACHTGLLPVSELPSLPPAMGDLVVGFYVYPNPAAGEAFVRYRVGDRAESASIILMDMAGEQLGGRMTAPVIAGPVNEQRVDLSRVGPGLYVLRLEVSGGGGRAARFAKLAVIR
jgi:M6 family metalloprotease-like protein